MPVDLLIEIDAQIQAAEDHLIRLRNARAALANHRAGSVMELPTIAGPSIDGLPLTQAIRQTLQWHYDRGREAMTADNLFEALKPHKVVTAKGASLWESEFPWKVFVITLTAPGNTARYWHVEKSIPGDRARLLKNDVVKLKPVKKPAT